MAVARATTIIASSDKSWQDAAEQGFKRATKTLRGITGMRVLEQTAHIQKNKIVEYRIRLEVLFLLED